MTLRGNTLVYHKNPQSELEFTLNHIAKKHTEITVTTKGPPTTVLLGIISPLRPSECRVCFGADKNRPESFDAKAGSGQKLIYFRCIGPAAPAPAFQPLFNGMDLDGWEGDTAFWRWGKGVLPKAGSGGELIGLETDPAVHNTRIWSSRTYKDFELEFDVRLRTDKQAAVIVRQTKELIGTKHDVTGFKVWLGGDTKLMGWGDAVWFRGAWTLKAKAKDAIKAVKNDDYYGSATCVGQASQPDTGCPSSSKCVSLESLTYELALSNYNRVLIRCVGKQLTVQINGVTVLDQEMKELPASGVLGFVKFVGPDVIFRNLRLREIAPSPPESAFQPLFNGMDLKGWKMIETQPFQAHQGQVKDGELIGRNKIGSWLFSDAGPIEDFHLRAEMKLVGAGDCGLHFRTQGIPFVPPPGYGVDLTVRKSPIGSLWKDGKHVKDAAKHMVAPDQWFTLEIIARGPKMKVLLNGQTVTEYTDPKWEHRKGGIALQQAHHGRFFPEENIIVHLRKIEIKDLSAGSPPGN
ncbi:MAG: DUF1080 domain-containing protein [Planctomycetes bacterium]|nr:DUF1080 domain-containing protein [Planctomycetota bacterium]